MIPNTLLTTKLTLPGLFDTTYGYDTRGRLTSINTNTRATAFTYNAQGFLASVTDPENDTTSYSYDPVGRITGILRPDGSALGFTYDPKGNMAVLTNPSSIDHGFGYNGINLNSSYQTPLSGSYSYVYDKDRRLIQTRFPSGKQITNIYDKTRLTQIQTPEGNVDLGYLCSTKLGSMTKGREEVGSSLAIQHLPEIKGLFSYFNNHPLCSQYPADHKPDPPLDFSTPPTAMTPGDG